MINGVALLRDVVYIICPGVSSILRFSVVTNQPLTDIKVKDLRAPCDIAVCEQTSQLYVAEREREADRECVWRVSADGADVKRWLPRSPSDKFTLWSLSVTSTRLLVTSRITNQLEQFDSLGNQLRRVQLPDDMQPHHAVESPTGTFIVSHYNSQLVQYQLSEVDTEGEVLRQFSSSSRQPPLGWTPHIAIDSRSNIIAADFDRCCVLLLDARLKLRRVIVDELELNYKRPRCLSYREQSGHLLVGCVNRKDRVAVIDRKDRIAMIAVFDVLRH